MTGARWVLTDIFESEEKTMLEVIGVGFGRTGTTSLKGALEQLGYTPCHTMLHLFEQPEQVALWRLAARGGPVDWTQVYAGYRATVDWPGARFWREITAAFPTAKVVLTVRDPRRWYASARDTIYAAAVDPVPAGVDTTFTQIREMSHEVVWDGVFDGRFEDAEYAIRVMEEHSRAVRAAFDDDRLLVFQVEQGWTPLCEFLGVPVPDAPFPHANERAEFTDRVRDFRDSTTR